MKPRFLKNTALVALAAPIFLSGCVSEGEVLRDKGYPVAYTEGYDDGCTSGKKAAGSMFDEHRKNVHRYQDDRDYHDGWEGGYRECRSQWKETEHQIERSQDQYNRDKYERDRYRW